MTLILLALVALAVAAVLMTLQRERAASSQPPGPATSLAFRPAPPNKRALSIWLVVALVALLAATATYLAILGAANPTAPAVPSLRTVSQARLAGQAFISVAWANGIGWVLAVVIGVAAAVIVVATTRMTRACGRLQAVLEAEGASIRSLLDRAASAQAAGTTVQPLPRSAARDLLREQEPQKQDA